MGEYSKGKATRNRALVVYKSGALRSVNMKYLVELVLRFVTLLTTWCAIHSADSVIRLKLARRIPLVAGPSTVIMALPVVDAP